MAGHCSPGGPVEVGTGTVVLAGNPNVGKSVVFHALTGTYVDVSNFPGTTVELTSGKHGDVEVIDTPGVYGVSSFNEEETVARDVILTASTLINVVDAVHLERDLFLTVQLADMGIPMVVALNMADEARREGVGVDRDLLEDLLGVPVVETVAVEGTGIDELWDALACARPGHPDPQLAARLDEETASIGRRSEALLVLEGDPAVSARHGVEPGGLRDEIYTRRRARVDDIAGHVVHADLARASLRARLSAAMMQPLTGIPMLIVLLGAMYLVIGRLVAGNVVGFVQGTLFEQHYYPFVQGLAGHVFATASPLYELMVGQFGLLTMLPATLLGVIFPLVTAFYFLLSVLEDTGYLPRIAALTDRSLTSMGLNGRAVIPLILGLGCVTMGTLTTRILGSRRERFIATTLMAIAVPCSAQLSIVASLMASTPPVYTVTYFAILLAVFVGLGTALNKLVPGESTSLLIDLPSLRLPRVDNIVQKTWTKVWGFMKEVTLFFVGGTLFLGLLKVTGALAWITNAVKPLITGWLGLPAQTATAFVMGLIRRDFGAAGFYSLHLAAPQLLVAMVTITLFVPCLASSLVVLKERGWRYLVGLVAASLGSAFLLGGVVSHVITLFGGAL